MKHNYKVHGTPTVKDEAGLVTNAAGAQVMAKVPSLEVILVPVDHTGGTIKFNYETAEDVAEAQEMYILDAVVTVTVTKLEAHNG